VNTSVKLPVGSPRSVNDPSSPTVVVMDVPWTVTMMGSPPAAPENAAAPPPRRPAHDHAVEHDVRRRAGRRGRAAAGHQAHGCEDEHDEHDGTRMPHGMPPSGTRNTSPPARIAPAEPARYDPDHNRRIATPGDILESHTDGGRHGGETDPDGYQAVTPYLVIQGASGAIEYYKKVFGATERMRMDAPGGMIGHAELLIGGSTIMLADEFPQMGFRGPKAIGGSPVSLMLYVPNVDEVFKRAVDAGPSRSARWRTSSTATGWARSRTRSGTCGRSARTSRTSRPRRCGGAPKR
jgi:uncharacterized glyoxalase superfamily protein PhnB